MGKSYWSDIEEVQKITTPRQYYIKSILMKPDEPNRNGNVYSKKAILEQIRAWEERRWATR